jgi:hypothetical protein
MTLCYHNSSDARLARIGIRQIAKVICVLREIMVTFMKRLR